MFPIVMCSCMCRIIVSFVLTIGFSSIKLVQMNVITNIGYLLFFYIVLIVVAISLEVVKTIHQIIRTVFIYRQVIILIEFFLSINSLYMIKKLKRKLEFFLIFLSLLLIFQKFFLLYYQNEYINFEVAILKSIITQK